MALLLVGAAAQAAERIVGYQAGILYVMDTDDCPSPALVSHALSDAVVGRLSDVEALSRLYASAIWWARSYCGTLNRDPLTMRVEYRVSGDLAATFTLTDRKVDARGDNLWWAERLTPSTPTFFDVPPADGAVQDYLRHLADSLLESDETARRKAAAALLEADRESLSGLTDDPTLAFSLARLQIPEIGGSVENIVDRMGNGSLYFDEQRGTECSDTGDAMQRAADLGSPVAAFVIARCAVDLHELSSGDDLKANIERRHAKGERPYGKEAAYDRFMFHMAKALAGGYAPAYGVVEVLESYADEFRRYAELLSGNGMESDIETLMRRVGGGASAAVTGLPGRSEMRAALNAQLLLPNCSKTGILFATRNVENVPLFSTVRARDGWCATTNFGARINLRFGELRDLSCERVSEGRFDCAVDYKVDCRIDSFESTAGGNRLICNLLAAGFSSGVTEVRRRADGVLVVERFRADRNAGYLRGVAPEMSSADSVSSGGGGADAVPGSPDMPEMRAELNRQLLPSGCSKIDVLFPAASNPALGAMPSRIASRKDWCGTEIIGTSVALRFGELRDMTCEPLEDDRFECSVGYETECELDGGSSARSGGTSICGIFGANSRSHAKVDAWRRADGVLVVERFRSGSDASFVAGVAPAGSSAD